MYSKNVNISQSCTFDKTAMTKIALDTLSHLQGVSRWQARLEDWQHCTEFLRFCRIFRDLNWILRIVCLRSENVRWLHFSTWLTDVHNKYHKVTKRFFMFNQMIHSINPISLFIQRLHLNSIEFYWTTRRHLLKPYNYRTGVQRSTFKRVAFDWNTVYRSVIPRSSVYNCGVLFNHCTFFTFICISKQRRNKEFD